MAKETPPDEIAGVEEPSSAVEQHDLKSPKRELGRLVVEEGESRYIENSFWVALSNEVI